MILADLGAEVIKVERLLSGDLTRRNEKMFNSVNRNKKSIAIDLKDNNSIRFIKSYLSKCDVVVEGFRPGVMERLGLGYEEVSKINNRIVYCSISGYGQTGSYALTPGHDINYLALSGTLSISGDPEGPPEAWGGLQLADFSSAMYAVISIMAALRNRDKTGAGDYLDVSITDSVFSWMSARAGQYYDHGKPSKERFMSKGAYGTYLTKDEQYIAIGALEDHFFKNLCDAINRTELKSEEKYKSWTLRSINAKELNTIIDKEINTKSLHDWLNIFAENDVPCSKVNSIEDLINTELFKERDMIQAYGSMEKGEYFINYPVKFLNASVRENKVAPDLGEHNTEIIENNN